MSDNDFWRWAEGQLLEETHRPMPRPMPRRADDIPGIVMRAYWRHRRLRRVLVLAGTLVVVLALVLLAAIGA